MSTVKELQIPKLDMSAFRKVGSTNLTNWQAINELIANSIDSWISNEERDELKISINISPSLELSDWALDITDNAMGMTKEEVIKSFDLFYSSKSPKSLSDKFLGLYGFGFKGATSKLGSEITVITSQNSRVFHQVKANYKFLENKKEKGITYQEFSHDNTTKQMFNGGYKGTRIIIKDFNTPLAEEVLLYYLPLSWSKFLRTNEFGLPVSINLNNTKILPAEINYEPATKLDLNYTFSWKENGEIQEGTAKGFVGLRFNNTSMATQGIHLYRRGQLVKPFEHSLYMAKNMAKHNDFNYLVGEIDVDLPATTTKTDFNIDSPAWESFISESKKELKPIVDQIKNKLKNKGTEVTSDKNKRNSFIASYRKDLSLDLSPKQQQELRKLSKEELKNRPKVNTKTQEDASIILYDWNTVKIGKQKISFEFKSIPEKLAGGRLYEVIQITDNKINIVYDKHHTFGDMLSKSLSNPNKNELTIYSLRTIMADAIEQTFRSRLSKIDLISIKNKFLEYPTN